MTETIDDKKIMSVSGEIIPPGKRARQPRRQWQRGQQINIGTLNIFIHPAKKFIGQPMKKRYDKHYHRQLKHGRKHLAADIILAGLVIGLVIFIGYVLFLYGRGI
ncbi:MAG TPA: hypothetical protein VGA49_02745, partial [Patescibacteria group bacterium]